MNLDFAPSKADQARCSPDEPDMFSNETGISNHCNTSGRVIRRSCDRCYSQKLKCTRNDAASHNRCIRCQKAGLRCSYGTRLPRHAPKKTGPSAPHTSRRNLRRQPLPSPGSSKRTPLTLSPLDEFDLDSIGPLSPLLSNEAQQGQVWSWQSWDAWTAPAEKPLFQPDRPAVMALDDTQSHSLRSNVQRTEHLTIQDGAYVRPPHCRLLEDLTCLSQRLESFFIGIVMVKATQDMHSYPIGETLDGSKRLLGILRQHQSSAVPESNNLHANNSVSDSFHKPTRTTDALLALHCYILCVKILATLCEKLLAHLSALSRSTRQTSRQDPITSSRTAPSPQLLTHEERLDHFIDELSGMALQTGLRLNELYSHLDPFGHALNCAYAAWSAGIKLLKGVELALDVPLELSVSFDVSSAEPEPGFGDLDTPVSAADAERPEVQTSSWHSNCREGASGGVVPSFSARLLAMLWEEEAAVQGSETALVVLRRCSKEIHRLVRQQVQILYRISVSEVIADLGSTNDALATFVVLVYIPDFAIGPLVIGPLREIYGGVPVYHVCKLCFICFTIGCAISTSMNMLMVFLFLGGALGVAPISNGRGTVADIVVAEQQGAAMAIYSIEPVLGPVIGPVAGGSLARAEGWRWVFWVLAIATAVLTIAGLLVLH